MFSVIIPVHNKLPHLERSINSVLSQSFESFELILIDDDSTDGSTEKLLEFNDPRIKRFKREKPGPGGYAARNLGINKAKHEWIAFLDADDEWDEDYLLERMNVLQNYPKAQIISSKYFNQIEGGKTKVKNVKGYIDLYSEFSLADYLNNSGLIWTGSVTIKRDLLIEVDMFPEGKCKRGGDLDTWIRCLHKSTQNIFINKALSVYYSDTVNQVTNSILNPATKLCSYETLENIRKQETDNQILNSVDVFCSRYVFSTIINEFRRNRKLNYNKLKMIKSKKIRTIIFLKASIYNILILFKIK